MIQTAVKIYINIEKTNKFAPDGRDDLTLTQERVFNCFEFEYLNICADVFNMRADLILFLG